MNTVRYHDKPKIETPHGVDVRKLHENQHVQVMHLELLPGEKLRKHITPVDVFFYVLEGTGIVEIGEEQLEVKKDTLIDSPAGIPHRLMNQGTEPFRFIVVKTPKPVKQAQML